MATNPPSPPLGRALRVTRRLDPPGLEATQSSQPEKKLSRGWAMWRAAARTLAEHARCFLRESSTSSATMPPLFKRRKTQPPTATQRRVEQTVREALDKTFASRIIKDRGFDDGAAVHVLDVQVSPGNSVARILWEPMSTRYNVEHIRRALRRKTGILRAHVNSWVNQRLAIKLEFVAAMDENGQPEQRTQQVKQQSALFEALQADLDARERRRREDAEAERIDTDRRS